MAMTGANDLLRRKLRVLECPLADDLRIAAEEDMVPVVAWLEDQKIRQLPPARRAVLRLWQPQEWTDAFRGYLAELGCPFAWGEAGAGEREGGTTHMDNAVRVLGWLADNAVALEYQDAVSAEGEAPDWVRRAERRERAPSSFQGGETAGATAAAAAASGNGDGQDESMVVENANGQTDEPSDSGPSAQDAMVQELHETCAALGVARETYEGVANTTELLHLAIFAAHRRNYAHAQAVSTATTQQQRQGQQQQRPRQQAVRDADADVVVDGMPLGFPCEDAAVARLAKVLRMLYLSDLRDLQTDVNDIIVAAQQYTADPRTNASLGKVGR